MSEALEALLANHKHHQDYDDYGGYKGSDLEQQNLEAIAMLQAALPSPQPAVPVVSDEQIRKTVESIQDPDTVHAFHNGYYTLTPDELRRAILALRPAVEPMTEWEIVDIFERWDNTSGASMSDFVRMVEAHHGITAKAEDAHQPTKEAEKP